MSGLQGAYDEMQILREESRDLASGRYKAAIVYGWDGANAVPLKTDADGNLIQAAEINATDIEIGAVELKNGTDDTRGTILAGDTGQNALLTAGNRKEVSFTTTTVQAVATTDISNYRHVSVHITSQGTGSSVTFQGSNDNSNWVSVGLTLYPATAALASASSVTATGLYAGAANYRYFRLNVTGISAGTTAGVIEFFSNSPGPQVLSATQSGTWTTTGLGVPGADTSAGGTYTPVGPVVLNAAGTWNRLREAPATTGTTGTGLLGSAPQLLGSTNYSSQKGSIAISDGDTGIGVPGVDNYLLNGTTWDKQRGNEDATLLASAARTTTQTSADLINYNGKAVLIVTLDVTSAGTGSVTLTIDRKDPASGKYINLLTGAAVVTNSTNTYQVTPDLAAVANSIAQAHLPRTFRIVVTANNANSVTYSVGYSLIRG